MNIPDKKEYCKCEKPNWQICKTGAYGSGEDYEVCIKCGLAPAVEVSKCCGKCAGTDRYTNEVCCDEPCPCHAVAVEEKSPIEKSGESFVETIKLGHETIKRISEKRAVEGKEGESIYYGSGGSLEECTKYGCNDYPKEHTHSFSNGVASKKEDNNLEEKIDQVFGDIDSQDFIGQTIRTKVKHIFRDSLAQARHDTKNEIIKMVEGIKKDEWEDSNLDTGFIPQNANYNEALAEIVLKLKGK